MVKVITLVAVAGIAAGCASKQTTAGLFVTDLRIDGRTLEVDRCRMDLDYEDMTGAAIAVCALSLGSLCGGSSRTWKISTPGCMQERSEIGGAP